MSPAAERFEATAVRWPEVTEGDDLAGLLTGSFPLQDGDIAVVTSKVVSKAAGLASTRDRVSVVESESVRVLARRGDAVIAETRHGVVMAAAGVDASNTEPGTVITLPPDPDRSAQRIREDVHAQAGLNIAVVVSDTAGRAWRVGQTDFAVGCAGIPPYVDLNGATDTHGNVLNVTMPVLADAVAAAGDLVKGKATGRPVAVIRGLAGLVLPVGDHGPGAEALVRDTASDMFGLGTREAAVAAALRDDPVALAHFPPMTPPDIGPFDRLATDDDDVRVTVTPDGDDSLRWTVQADVRRGAAPAAWVEAGRLLERAAVLGAGHRLASTPTAPADPVAGWTAVAAVRWSSA